MKRIITITVLASVALMTFIGCQKKEDENAAKAPTLTTTLVTDVTNISAISGGNVSSDGGAAVTKKGVVWDVNPDPVATLLSMTNDGSGSGSFVSDVTGLLPGTTYYLRAYAINSVGTSYGNQYAFTTSSESAAVVTTSSVIGVTQTTAICGGNVLEDGGSDVTQKGVCWSTSNNPTVSSSSKTNDGSGKGSYASSISGLTANTTYYVRAYATNSMGTVYGNELSFTTSAAPVVGLPTLITTAITGITITTAISGGAVVTDGGASVTARGVCWGTSTGPSVLLSTKTTNGTGTGTFVSNITGLQPKKKYYIRSYATNSAGTAYGNEYEITTDMLEIGDSYAGGKIAYLLLPGDVGYTSSVQHGLVAATSDISGSLPFGCSATSVGSTGTSIGSGESNTATIVSACGTGTAAYQCSNLTMNGYSDWFLPSLNELRKMFDSRAAVGGYASSQYWSSSQYSTTNAWFVEFGGSGGYSSSTKSTTKKVRPVRKF